MNAHPETSIAGVIRDEIHSDEEKEEILLII
jgi:hypothetical protein